MDVAGPEAVLERGLVLPVPAREVKLALECGDALPARAYVVTVVLHDAGARVLAPEQVAWPWSDALGAPFAYTPALEAPGTAVLPVLRSAAPFSRAVVRVRCWPTGGTSRPRVGRLFALHEVPRADGTWTAVTVSHEERRGG